MSTLGIGIFAVFGALVALFFVLLAPAAKLDPAAGENDAVQTGGSTPVYDVIERVLGAVNWRPFSDEDLAYAGVKQPVVSVVAFILVVSAGTFLLTAVLKLGIVIGLVALAVPMLVATFWVRSRVEKRQAAFAEQMTETITMLSSALKSGLNVSSGLATTAADIDAPMGEELTRVVNEARLGRDVVVALREAADRMHNEDLRWVADALSIQRETGGRLTEVLDQVNTTIRDRHTLRIRLHALSSEGRMSAYVLMSLPVMVAGMMLFVNPAFMMPLFTTGSGHLLLVGACALWVVGGLWMRSMSKVDL